MREKLNLALTHPKCIRNWYNDINGVPGFTKCAFDAFVRTDTENGPRTVCPLMLDEMAIRKHVEFESGQYHGYVNIGNGNVDDTTAMAKGALAIIAVPVNASWKVPIGYFLIDRMSGGERANLINESLPRLHTTGVQVVDL